MEEVKRSGISRPNGVSNYLRPHIETFLKTATIAPVIKLRRVSIFICNVIIVIFYGGKSTV